MADGWDGKNPEPGIDPTGKLKWTAPDTNCYSLLPNLKPPYKTHLIFKLNTILAYLLGLKLYCHLQLRS